jgi:hypothetical protein
MKYFHSLNEAMRISYFDGNKEVLQKCNNFSSTLILALFDVAHHRREENMEPSKSGNNMTTTLFEKYLSTVAATAEEGEEWIKSHCPNDLLNQYRVLLGWCLCLTRQFIFNYTYLCKRLHDDISQYKVPSFSVKELLSK